MKLNVKLIHNYITVTLDCVKANRCIYNLESQTAVYAAIYILSLVTNYYIYIYIYIQSLATNCSVCCYIHTVSSHKLLYIVSSHKLQCMLLYTYCLQPQTAVYAAIYILSLATNCSVCCQAQFVFLFPFSFPVSPVLVVPVDRILTVPVCL